jgi:GNAT superfamily N-acetyltransferase
MIVHTAGSSERRALEAFLARHNAVRVARLGELVGTLDWPALVAEEDGTIVGALTYASRGSDCEVLTLHAEPRRHGTGSALLTALERIAVERGWRRLWLITTNDNVDALRFYQRRGFRLAKLHVGAVDDARRQLKPAIPELGDHGIGIHDEIELVKPLR